MKKFLFVAALLASCSPEWADCPDCSPPAVAADAGSGTTIIVNVDNDVNVDVDQTQSVQVLEQDDPSGTCCSTPPVAVVDAGTPPKMPADCECKKVCKEHKRVHVGHGRWSCNKKDKLVGVKTVFECKRK